MPKTILQGIKSYHNANNTRGLTHKEEEVWAKPESAEKSGAKTATVASCHRTSSSNSRQGV